jgi:hypothetical protein
MGENLDKMEVPIGEITIESNGRRRAWFQANRQRSVRTLRSLRAANVDAPAKRPDTVRSWLKGLLPALAFLVTAATLFSQMHQNEVSAQKDEDGQWRASLDKVDYQDPGATIAVLKLESFLTSKRYAGQARTLTASLLPLIGNVNVYDQVLYSLQITTHQNGKMNNEQDVIDIARSVSNRLRGNYKDALRFHPAIHGDDPNVFSMFVRAPEKFLTQTDPDQAKLLNETLANLWKMDSATERLVLLWRAGPGKNGATVENQDLSGISFIAVDKLDLSGIQFSKADLTDTYFYGQCTSAHNVPSEADFCGLTKDVNLD